MKKMFACLLILLTLVGLCSGCADDTLELTVADVCERLYADAAAGILCSENAGEGIYVNAGELANALGQYVSSWSDAPQDDGEDLSYALTFSLNNGATLTFYGADVPLARLTQGRKSRLYAIPSGAYEAVYQLYKTASTIVTHPRFAWQAARTDGDAPRDSFVNGQTVVIGSLDELNTYYSANQFMHVFMPSRSDRLTGFANVAARYDDAFFDDYMLLLSLVETQSADAVLTVKDVALGDGSLCVVIENADRMPNAGEKTARFHVFIAIPRSVYRGEPVTTQILPVVREKNNALLHKVQIRAGSFSVAPYDNLMWEASFDREAKEWFCADGEEYELSDIAQDLPLVKYSHDITCVVSEDVDYVHFMLYDSTYHFLGEFETLDAASLLALTNGAGTYYVRLMYESFGEIPAGETQMENLGSEAFFKLKIDPSYLDGTLSALLLKEGVDLSKADSAILHETDTEDVTGNVAALRAVLSSQTGLVYRITEAPDAEPRSITLKSGKRTLCTLQRAEDGLSVILPKAQYGIRSGAWLFDAVWEAASGTYTGLCDELVYDPDTAA